MTINTIIEGDCAKVLSTIPDNAIPLTVTSPPYDNLRTYKGFTFDFQTIARELYRVTTTGGVVVWVVGDATIDGSETGTSFRQALFFMGCGFNLWDTMIYEKANPLPLNARRYEPAFEYMFVLSKGVPRTFNPIRVPCKHAGKLLHGGFRRADGTMCPKTGNGRPIKPDKVHTNVFVYNAQSGNKASKGHPAVFPEQLAKDQIATWSNAGDIVLDPFCGSGTTIRAALELGRNYLGIEISSEYAAVARASVAPALDLAA
jgi:site-specific DNA-methyltransferase (adenine-specific)